MEDFKQRLLEETQELATKLNKLNEFMASETFIKLSRVEKNLLYNQVATMNSYIQILGTRLEYYNIEFKYKENE